MGHGALHCSPCITQHATSALQRHLPLLLRLIAPCAPTIQLVCLRLWARLRRISTAWCRALHVVNNHFHFHDPMRQSPAGAAGAAGAVGSVGAASGDATRRAEELQPAEALEEQTPAARPASSGAANPLSSPDKDAPVRHFAQAD